MIPGGWLVGVGGGENGTEGGGGASGKVAVTFV